MFQIKDFSSIAASMINWMRTSTKKITDFNVGSVARTLVEAPAAEIEELYQQMFIGLKEAIPVSVYNSFDFNRIEAVSASGLVRVVVTSSASAILVPAGTTFTTPANSTIYTSTQDRTIAIGNTFVDVPVAAGSPGLVGNLDAGSSFVLGPTPANFISASNLVAFSNGLDQESDDQRKLRFNAFIASLNRGTVAALDYGLKLAVITDSQGNETERVVSAKIVEPWVDDNAQPVGLVNCYIHNGIGATSSALVNRAREILYGYYDSNGQRVPGWKAAGVNVNVYAATEQPLNVTGNLTPASGYVEADLIAAANLAIAAYIRGLPVGDAAIRSEIIAIVMNIDGVYNFTVSAPAGDTSVAKSVKLMPGTLTIT